MMSISSRFAFSLVAVALIGLSGCKDSGHSLGNSRIPDAANGDVPVATGGSTSTGGSSTQTGGSTGTGGATAIGGSKSTGGGTAIGGTTSGGGAAVGGSISSGGATGGAGGRGGTSTASDAGAAGGDADTGTCGLLHESCASRPCCGPLLCITSSGSPSCYESFSPPTVDVGVARDTPGTSADSGCPICPYAMRCAYGSPVDSNGCMLCECNPAPDGGLDTSAGCGLPEGCGDAAASTPCPSAPPVSGSICVGQTSCFYDVCPSSGRTQATCTAGKWVVATAACGEVSCQGTSATGFTCPSGQVCLARIGGARLISCIANACGTGPASPDCSTFTQDCTPIFSLSNGVTYYCNTCTTGETCA